MSLFWILIIMLAAGVIGGIINYLLTIESQPAKQADPATTVKAPSVFRSIIIGLGATILVPFFLELAQSK